MQFTQVPATTFQTLQINAGILVDGFTPATGVIGNILGATTGGITFNANPNYEDFGEDVDNVHANTKQLKRVVSYDPTASGNFVTVSAALAGQLSGPGAAASGDSTHYVPEHGFAMDIADDIWIVGDYSDKNTGAANAGYVAIHIMDAINTTGFQWTTTKDGKGQFAFEFHGHYDMTNPDVVPYEIYVKAGTTSMASLTVTSEAGSSSGKSKITVSGYTLGTGEAFVYKTAESTAPGVSFGDIVTSWTALTSGSDITPAQDDTKITVAVMNSDGRAIGSGNATLVVA